MFSKFFYILVSLIFLLPAAIYAQTPAPTPLTPSYPSSPPDKPVISVTKPSAPDKPTPPERNRVIVKFQDLNDARAIVDKYQAEVISEIPKLGVHIITTGNDPDTLVGQLTKEKVEYAEKDGLATKTSVDDTLLPSQWSLPKVSWTLLDQSLAQFNGLSTEIAIVDTGVDYTHPDLSGKVDTTNDWDFVNNDNDAMDDESHGTHVAGIAAASTNNSSGVASVSINSAKILPVKVLDQNGSGYYSWISNGIIWATDHGAKVINLSLGGTYNSITLQNAVNYAWNKGVVVVAAAGNSSSTRSFYPASYTNSMAVWASTQNDMKASFSNFGSWVDIGAPGVSIISTVPSNLDTDSKKDGYSSFSGTSMSTPIVSGTAALIFASHPDWSAQQVRNKLESSADPVSDRNFSRGRLGKGRINVSKALTP